MNKKFLVMFLIVVALLTMAQTCQNNNNTGATNIQPFRGGTRALSIQFADGAPPDEVFDANTYPFDVEIKLLNVGENDINANDVTVKLSGINPIDFGLSESEFIKQPTEDVLATIVDSEGNTIDAPPVFVSFPNLAFVDTLPGNNQFPIRADVCYSYKTEAFADGCILSDVLSPNTDSVCTVHEAKDVFNSGAPIQVEEFTEQPSGTDKVRYVFKLVHKGTGRVFNHGSKCPSEVQVTRQNENRIRFSITSTLAEQQNLRCSPLRDGTDTSGSVLLVNGEATVHCVQQSVSNLDYVDKVRITLEYDYKEFIEKPLLVKKSIN